MGNRICLCFPKIYLISIRISYWLPQSGNGTALRQGAPDMSNNAKHIKMPPRKQRRNVLQKKRMLDALDVGYIDKNDKKIAFTSKFIEMLEILHLGIATKTPIIFEGGSGQGKKKAIEYFSNALGLNVLNIAISNLTKVEDLLTKVNIESDSNNKADRFNNVWDTIGFSKALMPNQ